MNTLEHYKKESGVVPFDDWFEKLDKAMRSQIGKHLTKLEFGKPAVRKGLKDSVSELKINKGPGYRIYYATIGRTTILILSGGTKRTQKRDIDKAKEYYQDYIMRKSSENKGK